MSDEKIVVNVDAYDSNAVSHSSIVDIAGLRVTPSAFLFQTRIDPQSYFWSLDWQLGEREAEEDIAMGNTRVFPSIDDAMDWLESDDE